jgi:hypothetical protein
VIEFFALGTAVTRAEQPVERPTLAYVFDIAN